MAITWRTKWLAAGFALAGLAGISIRTLLADEAAKSPATVSAVAAKESPRDAAHSEVIGRRVPSFVAKNVAGEARGLADFADKRAVVVVFLSTECPIANKYLPLIAELTKKDAD